MRSRKIKEKKESNTYMYMYTSWHTAKNRTKEKHTITYIYMSLYHRYFECVSIKTKDFSVRQKARLTLSFNKIEDQHDIVETLWK